MHIVDISIERYDLDLTEPYTIMYETVYNATNFVLKIRTDSDEITGYGCAAPDSFVTGETPFDVEQSYYNHIYPALQGADPFHFTEIISNLKAIKSINSSALAMVDMALFDLVSKFANVPLYKYLGAYRNSIPTSITISIMPFDEMMKKAAEFIEKGFFIFKIKGGLDWEEDVYKLKSLREKYPAIALRFDANQGYSLDDSLKFASKAESLKLEIFEQPMPINQENQYTALSQYIPQDVMADESLKTLKDSFRLASNGLVNMLNIKLMKVGGIQEGMHINSVAKSAGYDVMIGCLDECQLGISAGLHFALSRPNIIYADLDSFLDFEKDPYQDLIILKKGILYPNQNPGLGISGQNKSFYY